MEEIRKQILKYLEKNSRADLGELGGAYHLRLPYAHRLG